MSSREPANSLGKVLRKLRVLIRLLGTDVRTAMAVETLLTDYRHAKGQLQLGHRQPIPWYTYPMLEHLLVCDRVRPPHNVTGSGDAHEGAVTPYGESRIYRDIIRRPRPRQDLAFSPS